MAKKEIMITSGPVEIRSNEDGTKQITGQAVVFNSDSRAIWGEFVERILPGALDEANMERVIARGEHSNNNLLGTTMGGTLQLDLRDDGLYYTVDVPDTEVGRAYAHHIERGDIQDSSFAFSIARSEGSVKWINRGDDGKLPLREIRDIETIYDVSPVLTGAYPAASAGMRSFEDDPRIAELRAMQEEWNKPAPPTEEEQLRAESESLKLIHKTKTLKR